MGNLYKDHLQLPEQSLAFFQRAVDFYRDIQHAAGEGLQLNNQADALRKLQRFEEARAAITRAIQCNEAYGHAATPWTAWDVLAAIETEAGNLPAAAVAQQQARDAYLAYRRDGGENQDGPGRLALEIRQAFAAGIPAGATTLLQQLVVDPDMANQLPFLTALQAIIAGSRDRSLAEDPALHYSQAAEVLLLIEALQGPEAGGGG